jgi:hypothetical protein
MDAINALLNEVMDMGTEVLDAMIIDEPTVECKHDDIVTEDGCNFWHCAECGRRQRKESFPNGTWETPSTYRTWVSFDEDPNAMKT